MPLRSLVLYIMGVVLSIALSPDAADGLSDEDFSLLNSVVPTLLPFLKYSGIASLLGLPDDFILHYDDQVLPEIQTIRNNPAMRAKARFALHAIITNPQKLADLYTYRNGTYSDILAEVTGSKRVSYTTSLTPPTVGGM